MAFANKLGRQAPVWTPANMHAAQNVKSTFAALGPPPASSADFVSAVTDLVGDDWGMMGNDRIGNCTAADCGHGMMIRTANTGTWKMPSEAEIVALYSAMTGYDPHAPRDARGNNPTDQGALETDVCAYMRDVGLLGHRSVGTAPLATGRITANSIDRIKWSIQLFGGCRLGVNLPASADEQFAAGLPWTVSGDLTIEGGHDVDGVRYDPNYLEVVTWGGLQRVRWDWLALFGEEAHAEVWPDFLMSTGLTPGTNFSLDALVAGLAGLAA